MRYFQRKAHAISSLAFAILLLIPTQSFAEHIYLTNGDRITGEILLETKETLKVQNDVLGPVTLKKEFVDYIETADATPPHAKPPAQKPKVWNNTFEAGLSQVGGNTQSQSGLAQLSLKRKTDKDEWIISAKGSYSSANGEMDDQKFSGIIRYAFSFGNQKKWYNFYKLEGSKDRFSNIDYRLVPTIGAGYWFFDTEDYKVMVEAGLGFEHTAYRDGTDTTNEPVLVPRAYFEKKLIRELKLSQEIILYPELGDFKDYRTFLKTDLTHPINETLSWKISFTDEYNSNPPGSTEKNDYRLTSSMVYSF